MSEDRSFAWPKQSWAKYEVGDILRPAWTGPTGKESRRNAKAILRYTWTSPVGKESRRNAKATLRPTRTGPQWKGKGGGTSKRPSAPLRQFWGNGKRNHTGVIHSVDQTTQKVPRKPAARPETIEVDRQRGGFNAEGKAVAEGRKKRQKGFNAEGNGVAEGKKKRQQPPPSQSRQQAFSRTSGRREPYPNSAH